MTVADMPLAWAPARRGRDGRRRKPAAYALPAPSVNKVIGLAAQLNLSFSGALELILSAVDVTDRGRILGTRSWGEEKSEAPEQFRDDLVEDGLSIRQLDEDGELPVTYYLEVTTIEKIHRVASHYRITKAKALAKLIDQVELDENGHSVGTLGPLDDESREEELPLTGIS